MEIEKYFKRIEGDVKKVYSVAEEARSKGFDPKNKVEIPLARNLAEKVVGLVSVLYPQMEGSKIAERILELEKEHGKLDPAICLQIAEEIAKQKFCKFSSLLEAITAGARIGFAYITLGVVSSPIEGLTEIKIEKTRDGKEYLSAYYSGPIRSAGGTGGAFSLVIVDYLREIFGFSKYDPTEDEVRRAYMELTDYHERVTNLQYFPTENEAIFLVRNLPLQVEGEASEKYEVSNYKNLDRVSTDFIRNGFCLVLGESLAQKAPKVKKYIDALRKKGYKLSDWDFLEGFIDLHKKREEGHSDVEDSPTYIKDLVAGRPIFGYPSRSGAFRFRYGRGRVSGFSAFSLHPATMAITDNFISIGTQLKIEKPTKGGIVTSCDSIDGPIVKLYNGSVKKVSTKEEAERLYPDTEEIIYLGDILFPLSDLLNRNHGLIKAGYVEEWWNLDLEEKGGCVDDFFKVSFEDSVELSKKFNVPLHPSYILYWSQISDKQFFELIRWLKVSKASDKIIFPYRKNERDKCEVAKRALELLGLEHEVTIENVVLSKEKSKVLLSNLGIGVEILENEDLLLNKINESDFEFKEGESVLDLVNRLSNFVIKDKAGDFIGARMAKPDKAKLRKLSGSPNVLFPVGREGGRLRSVQEACEVGKVRGTFPIFENEESKEEIFPFDSLTGKANKKIYFSRDGKKFEDEFSEGEERSPFLTKDININDLFEEARQKVGFAKHEMPVLVKGVRGLSSSSKVPENLVKGILRAYHKLHVNKDGTVRMDANEVPLVAFKPKEIGTSVESLKGLGYDRDIYGNELENEEQILELMPHDILLPGSKDSLDERGDEVFMQIANFVDDLLVRVYKMGSLHNIKSREDLIGQLGVCMAPHNCAGVICRFIGFAGVQGLLASPYMHAAMRRDCDGDEAAIMLLSDVLLNFSTDFLPSHRGGNQDAPLVLNARIDVGEVDDQILDFEVVPEGHYPVEIYRMAEERKHSSEINVLILKDLMKENKNPYFGLGFTHDSSNINEGISCSSYKIFTTMQDKLQHQMGLVEKIRAADASDIARLVIERHFIRDMRGNLRKFSMQGFRCVVCNGVIRRPPLTGVCPVCKGKIVFTIHEGGIKKYLELSLELAEKYNLSPYLKQSLELTKRYVDSVFGKELEKQETIEKWF